MHLQQTKKQSIATGGPQYYTQSLSESVRSYLRLKGNVRVALGTPYGATKSGYSVASIQESDILRASGTLKLLGVSLSAYVGKGYDCLKSEFKFLNYPSYQVPVEIKKHSNNFIYQKKKYGPEELSRAVVLCAVHDLKNTRRHIDVIELRVSL